MLNPLQLHSYRIEYETSDISIEHLKLKYNIPDEYTLDTSKWAKRNQPITPSEVIILPPVDEAPPELPPDTSSSAEIIEMLENIHEFKKLTIQKALSFMKDDSEWAEVKEIKDMVAIVDSVEKSIRPQAPDKPAGVTIQVLVQNLMSEFKRDC